MKTKHGKRALSFLLALVFAFYLIPTQALALDVPEEDLERLEAMDPRFLMEETGEPGEAETADSGTMLEEIPDRRDAFQKEYLLDNGLREMVIYPMAVHYEEDGVWKEIDNTLLLSEKDGREAYRNTAGMWDVFLPLVLDGETGICVERDGHAVRFLLTGELIGSAEKTEEPEDPVEPEEPIVPEMPVDSVDTETPSTEEEPAPEEDAAPEEPSVLDEPEATEPEEPTAGEETGSTVPEEAAVPEDETVASEEEEPVYELQPINSAEAVVEEEKDIESALAGTLAGEVVEKSMSSVTYREIGENTDLRYDLVSNRLKETLTIREYREDLSGYRYLLETGDLELRAGEDGEIRAYVPGEEEPVFWLPAPFLYDAERRICRDVEIVLEKTDGGYALTYLLPKEWLANDNTAYPVSMDPIIQPVSNTFTISDQSVSQYHNLDYLWGCVETGFFPTSTGGGGKERIFMKFNNLPSLTSADVVVSASVSMYKCYDRAPIVVEAHQVNGSWESSTITWSNMPGCTATVEDYNLTEDPGWYTWDITNIAQNWYKDNLNSGVMFRTPDSVENGSTEKFDQYYSSDYSPAAAPFLTIAYINNCGLESMWDYTSHSMGRAGTGHVNDYTGNLVWVHEGLGFSGNRMPVSIEHIYSANDKDSNRFGLGYGWRTNYNQLVYQWSEDSSYYVWEDADGTRHYFKYKSSGLYEDENGSGLKLTNTGSGTTKYCITDKQNNKSYFDTGGRLTRISNNQATVSSINVSYTASGSKLISQITDGAGRVYQFVYSGSALTRINFLGTGSTALSYLTFAQSSSNLTGIGYLDGKSVSFGYGSGHLLTQATDIDGCNIRYTYNTVTSSKQPYRVIGIAEYDGTTAGGSLAIEYAHNQTTFTDHNGNREIMQFNRYGSTMSVQDGLGRGAFFRYAGNNSVDKATQMTLSSKLQDTVINLARNSSFEQTGSWGPSDANVSTGSWSYSTAQHYLGSRSLAITRTENDTPFSIAPANSAVITVEPGKTYTMSAYVKTTGMNGTGTGAYLWLSLRGHATVAVASSDKINTNSDWTRLELTYTHPADAAQNTCSLRIASGSVGTAYFDCVQIEESTSASRYNIIENGDFRVAGSTDADSYRWTRTAACDSQDRRISAAGDTAAPQMDGHVYSVTGSVPDYKRCYQTVSSSGSAGDVYTVAGWAKGDSVPLTGYRRFGIICRFVNTDGTYTDRTVFFNPDTDSSNCWQYLSTRAVADKAYSSMIVALAYDYNQNTAWFDGIQLFREEFGHSYVYDTDGNLTSVTDLQKKTTTYEYSNNNLTRIVLPGNASQSYTYDSYHNVTKSTSPEGVEASFTYDTYGNNTKVSMTSGGKTLQATATYTSGGNLLSTVTDALGNTTTYGYDTQTGILNWLQEPGQDAATRTEYTYDNLYRTTDVEQDSAAVSYSYDNRDLLSTLVSPSGTEYDFTYRTFGQTAAIGIGDYTLISNSYTTDGNFRPSRATYGNGDYVDYTYDNYGRVTDKTWEDGDTVSYVHGTDGSLGRMTDSGTGRTTKYYYDFQGRVMRVDESGTDYGNSVQWNYNDKNELSSLRQVVHGTEYNTYYSYDNDSRLSHMNKGIVQVFFDYDGFSRLSELTVKRYNLPMVTTDITYQGSSGTTTSSQVSTWRNKVTDATTGSNSGAVMGDTTFSYTYDQRGNITSISDGTSTTTYVYDGKDQLLRENNQAANKTWVYTYDNGGNILTKKEYARTTGDLGVALTSNVYTYGDATWKDLLTAYGDTALSYDAIGNLTADGAWTYSWEHGRQLAGMSKAGVTISYDYDADGRRVSKTVNGQETGYYYQGDRLIEVKQGNTWLHYNYDSIGPASAKYVDTIYYFLRNAQGDVLGIVDSWGNEVVSYSYDAWGNILSTTGSMANTLGKLNVLRYRGYVYDEETGLYYLKTRYYNPAWGRFINADGYASTGQGMLGSNMFAYCNSNPTNYKDPSGTEVYGVFGGTISGGFGVAGSVGTMVIWDDKGNCGQILTGFVGGGIPNIGVAADLFLISDAEDIFRFTYGLTACVGWSAGFFSTNSIIGEDTEGRHFYGQIFSAGFSAIPLEAHAGIGYACLTQLYSYQNKQIPADITMDFFSDLPSTIQKKIQRNLLIPSGQRYKIDGAVARGVRHGTTVAYIK